MDSVRLEDLKRLILSLHALLEQKLVDYFFVSLALNVEVWKVLALVDPVSYCSLDLQHYWDQNFLNHL